MDSRDSGKDRDIIPINSRKSGDPLAGGRVDPRSSESALAREFAQRALTPVIANLRNRQGLLEAGRVARALGITVTQLAECLDLPKEVLAQSPPPP